MTTTMKKMRSCLYYLIALAIATTATATIFVEAVDIAVNKAQQGRKSDESSSSALSFVSSCRSAGFDPFTLACTTCTLLKNFSLDENSINDASTEEEENIPHYNKCQQCCQSWKSLDGDDDDSDADFTGGGAGDDSASKAAATKKKRRKRKNRRYQSAVLIHSNVPGLYPSVDEMIREDKDRILLETRQNSFQIKIVDSGFGDGDDDAQSGMLQLAMMMGGGNLNLEPSSILWYDHTTAKDVQQKQLSIDEMKERAVEVTPLRGMSRDDIRDMLLALLPKPK